MKVLALLEKSSLHTSRGAKLPCANSDVTRFGDKNWVTKDCKRNPSKTVCVQALDLNLRVAKSAWQHRLEDNVWEGWRAAAGGVGRERGEGG